MEALIEAIVAIKMATIKIEELIKEVDKGIKNGSTKK